MRWFDGITDSMGMNLGKVLETVRDRKAWSTAAHAVPKNLIWLGDWITTRTRSQKTCTHKTIKYRWKKSKMTNRWRDTPCSWMGRIKMIILLKAIYRFNAVLIKLPMVFFTDLEQKFWQFVRKYKISPIAKESWERKMELEAWGSLTSDCTTDR